MKDHLLDQLVASRYRILAVLGRGGLGTVYRAFDTSADRIVVLKTLHTRDADGALKRRLLHEATVLENLHHPNILKIYDHGEAEGIVYLALEYIDAESLAKVLTRKISLAPDSAVAIVREVARALRHAHRRDVIHRDVKPGNILIARDGRVVISDFGLALPPGAPTLTATGAILGTPRYMSPEQARGETADPRSDIFSLGTVLYELLAGVAAFSEGSAVDVLRHIVERDPPSLQVLDRHIPRPLARITSKALAKNPASRFQSADEFVRALDATGLATYAADRLIELVEPQLHTADDEPQSTDQASGAHKPDRHVADAEPGLLPIGISSDDDPTVSALPYVRNFEAIWRELQAAAQHNDKEGFVRLTDTIVHGAFRETIGYRVEHQIPYFRGTVGYMVDAPMLWIRHSRFPVLFVAFDPAEASVLPVVVKQLEIARATEFFALLVVVPTKSNGGGNEVEELRHQVTDSVYRHDFVVLDGRHLASIIEEGSAYRLVEVILQQGVALYSLSPYVVNGPVPERMFFGREQEVKAISQNVHDRDFAVLGGRRIGKSSILLRLNRLLNSDPRFRAVYINCEDIVAHRDFLEVLGSDFGVRAGSSDGLSVRQLITRIAKSESSRRMVFLLDEVDELLARDAAAHDGPGLFKTFRSLSHQGTCRFVFAGSRTLYSHLRDSGSPFFNFCEALILRPLDQKSVAEIVAKPMRQLGIEVLDEERFIDLLTGLTSSHPNITQWMCDRLIKRTIETGGGGVQAVLQALPEQLRESRRITVEDLQAIAITEEFQEHYVTTAWGDAGPLEKLISLVVEEPTFTAGSIHAALERYGITDTRMIAESVRILELYSLIERRGQEYRFRLTEFPRIVREFDGIAWQIECALTEFQKGRPWS